MEILLLIPYPSIEPFLRIRIRKPGESRCKNYSLIMKHLIDTHDWIINTVTIFATEILTISRKFTFSIKSSLKDFWVKGARIQYNLSSTVSLKGCNVDDWIGDGVIYGNHSWKWELSRFPIQISSDFMQFRRICSLRYWMVVVK